MLYRRWRDRHEVVHASNGERLEAVTVISTHLGDYHRETGTSPAELKSLLLAGRRPILDQVFERVVERGEVVDASRLTDRMPALPFDLPRNELMMTLAPVPDKVIREIVDGLFLPLVLAQIPHRPFADDR